MFHIPVFAFALIGTAVMIVRFLVLRDLESLASISFGLMAMTDIALKQWQNSNKV